jgi:hypothetical protein
MCFVDTEEECFVTRVLRGERKQRESAGRCLCDDACVASHQKLGSGAALAMTRSTPKLWEKGTTETPRGLESWRAGTSCRLLWNNHYYCNYCNY